MYTVRMVADWKRYVFAAVINLYKYSRHLHPLQAANCCRNSRLVVDVDDECKSRQKPFIVFLVV